MTYKLTVILPLTADTDEAAKLQTARVLHILAMVARNQLVTFDGLGLQLLDADGDEVDLPYPEFPKSKVVDQEDI